MGKGQGKGKGKRERGKGKGECAISSSFFILTFIFMKKLIVGWAHVSTSDLLVNYKRKYASWLFVDPFPYYLPSIITQDRMVYHNHIFSCGI